MSINVAFVLFSSF